jgi:hypothetical protein
MSFLHKQRGQSMMEYTVVCGALAFALFYPIQDAGSPDQAKTAVQIVLDGFKLAYQKFSYAISIPT